MTDDLKPWQRQPGESAAAFHAFSHLLEQPAETRSHRNAYRTHCTVCRGRQSSGKRVSGRWSTWSIEHRWQHRLRAWDEHLAEQKQKEAEAELLALSRRHAQQAQAAQAGLLTPVRALLDRLQRNPDRAQKELDDLTVPQLVRLSAESARHLPTLAQLERLARGLETDAIRITTDKESGPSLADLVDGDDRAEELVAELVERMTVRALPPHADEQDEELVDAVDDTG